MNIQNEFVSGIDLAISKGDEIPAVILAAGRVFVMYGIDVGDTVFNVSYTAVRQHGRIGGAFADLVMSARVLDEDYFARNLAAVDVLGEYKEESASFRPVTTFPLEMVNGGSSGGSTRWNRK